MQIAIASGQFVCGNPLATHLHATWLSKKIRKKSEKGACGSQ